MRGNVLSKDRKLCLSMCVWFSICGDIGWVDNLIIMSLCF